MYTLYIIHYEFIYNEIIIDERVQFVSFMLQNTDAPSVIVAGSAAAVILANNNSDTQLYSEYTTGLIRLVQPVDFLAKKGSQFLWLLQDPVLKERLPAQLSSLDNRQISLCNTEAEKVTLICNIVILAI